MNTAFVSTRLKLWDGLEFTLDGNSKITNSLGTYESPKPNAFSLPHISSCPGSTPICRSSCYANGLEKRARETYEAYRLNAAALGRVLISRSSAGRAAGLLAQWISENCAGGYFRWHVSGDVMSERHADWIANVCRSSPTISHWIYTRSFFDGPNGATIVDRLRAVGNLAVNLSVDDHNIELAYRLFRRSNDVRFCYLAHEPRIAYDLGHDSVIFPDYPQRGRELEDPTRHTFWRSLADHERRQVCPADFFGQSEQHRCGPCKKCMRRPGE